jgi:hypothetical protein
LIKSWIHKLKVIHRKRRVLLAATHICLFDWPKHLHAHNFCIHQH